MEVELALVALQAEVAYSAAVDTPAEDRMAVPAMDTMANHIQGMVAAVARTELALEQFQYCEYVHRTHLLVLQQYTLVALQNRRGFHLVLLPQWTFLCLFE